eukprot:9278477-Lingulodinium_polyedra.AAC.1
MKKWLRARGLELGSQWVNFIKTVVRADNTLNWQTVGCFTFRWGENNTVVAIKHVSGEEVTDLPVAINE